VRARLKNLDSADLPEDPARPGHLLGLEDFEPPPDPHSFRLRITAAIGADEGDGEDMFYFTVSSPDPAAAVGLSSDGRVP